MLKYIITTEMSLVDALAHLAPKSSKTTLREWIREGRVLVDGAIERKQPTKLQPGQTVSLGPKVRFLESGVRLLYEDKDLLAIEKPRGLLSVASNFEKGDTAHGVLKRAYKPNQVHVVHRLDQDTSGVMLFALSEAGRDGLKDLFLTHDLQRQYIAIVEGHLEEKQGTWTSYLYEDPLYKVHETDDPSKGQIAITHYQVEATSRKCSRLRLTLETGRKNQIRVHCQKAGHPIVGDAKYGAKTNPINRLALHSARLELFHPITGKKLVFISNVPEAFKKLVPTQV